jgi:hypothetical protein
MDCPQEPKGREMVQDKSGIKCECGPGDKNISDDPYKIKCESCPKNHVPDRTKTVCMSCPDKISSSYECVCPAGHAIEERSEGGAFLGIAGEYQKECVPCGEYLFPDPADPTRCIGCQQPLMK